MLHARVSTLVTLFTLCSASTGVAQSTAVVSAGHSGLPCASGSNDWVVLSRDGTHVAFATSQAFVVPGDTNLVGDVFVRDRTTGTTTAASVSSDGTIGNAASIQPSISADGRYVAFASDATNLTTNEAHGYPDIYVRDRQSGTTERATVSLLGSNPYGESWAPSISDDGRFVAYMSEAANIVAGDSNGLFDIFVFDRVTATTERVSVASDGTEADKASYFFGAIHAFSSDGRYLVFWSDATNLVPGDTNQSMDIFLRDRQLGTTEAVSVGLGGALGSSSSNQPSMSADGRFVAFTSAASNLVAGHTGFSNDVFVRDLLTGTNELVDVGLGGALADAGAGSPRVSADGRFVLFHSQSTNLVAGDINGKADIFLRDRLAGTTELVSVDTGGAQSAGKAHFSDLSGDGRFAIFGNDGPGLVGNTLVTPTTYLRDRALSAEVTVYCTAKVNSAGCAPRISSTGLPQTTGSDDFYSVADRLLPNKYGLLLWGSTQAAIPFGGGLLCIQPPVKRTTAQTSGNPFGGTCGGAYSFHFSHAYMASQGLGAGSVLHVQTWSRDLGFAPPNNMSLSDALTVHVTL